MQSLLLSTRGMESVRNGDKVNTIRRGMRLIKPGPLEFRDDMDQSKPITVMVTDVLHMPLIEIPRVISTRETIDDLLPRLREHYPDIDPNQMVTLIEFKPPLKRR